MGFRSHNRKKCEIKCVEHFVQAVRTYTLLWLVGSNIHLRLGIISRLRLEHMTMTWNCCNFRNIELAHLNHFYSRCSKSGTNYTVPWQLFSPQFPEAFFLRYPFSNDKFSFHFTVLLILLQI